MTTQKTTDNQRAMLDLKEGVMRKGGVNARPTTPRPAPPQGQGGMALSMLAITEVMEKLKRLTEN